MAIKPGSVSYPLNCLFCYPLVSDSYKYPLLFLFFCVAAVVTLSTVAIRRVGLISKYKYPDRHRNRDHVRCYVTLLGDKVPIFLHTEAE